jgi:hypothetical protein
MSYKWNTDMALIVCISTTEKFIHGLQIHGTFQEYVVSQFTCFVIFSLSVTFLLTPGMLRELCV